MALTITVSDNWTAGNKRVIRGTCAFDASYATGGESFTAAQIQLNKLDHITFAPTNGIVFQFDYTNNKVKAYYQNYGTILAKGTAVVSGTSTTTQALLTYAVPAGMINANGLGLEAEFWGTAASNTTAKSAMITFGTTALVTTGSTVINGVAWYVSANLLTVDTSDQDAIGWAQFSTTQAAMTHTAPGETLTTSVTLACQVVTAVSGHMTLTGYRINAVNAASTLGELVEVTSASDLSATTTRWQAWGV